MPCSDIAARALYRANSPQLVNVVNSSLVKLRRPADELTAPSLGVRCHVCRRADQVRFRRGEQTLTSEGIIWRSDRTDAQARMSAELIAGRHLLQHREEVTIRLPLPGSWVRTWHAEDGDDLGAALVEDSARRVVLELPPPALAAFVARVIDEEARASAARGRSRQAEEINRCATAMGKLGLMTEE